MSFTSQHGLSPSDLTSMLATPPLFSVGGDRERSALLQHYRHTPGPAAMTVSPLRDNLLIINLSGHVLIEDAQSSGHCQRRWAGSGQMSLMPAGMGAARGFKGHSEVLMVHLPAELVHQTAAESGLRDESATLAPRLAVADEVIEKLGRLLLAAASDQQTGAASMLDALTRALVVHLLRKHSVTSPDQDCNQAPLSGGKLQRVVAHMQTHIDEDLPLATLAALAELSPSQFARTFRSVMGKAPHGYLLDLRIERARQLLESTELAVTEIGMQCGFDQPNHFATMFKKTVGLSPRAWRIARRT